MEDMSQESQAEVAPPEAAVVIVTEDDAFKEYQKVAWAYAMRYLQAGWSIIPIRLSDKQPAIEWTKYQTERASEDMVSDWFENGVPDGVGGLTKAFGLGVITGEISGVVVLDCDNQEAIAYALAEANLFTMLSVSTTRGQHFYFSHPGGRVINKAGGIGREWPDVPGLDLRGDGGFVVAPPSLKFSDGKLVHSYRFNCPEEEIENFMGSLPVWPGLRAPVPSAVSPATGEWSFDNLKLDSVKAYGSDVWSQMDERVKSLGRKLVDGDGRNAWLTRYIGSCVASGMDEGSARTASGEFQETFFAQALPQAESETVLQSVLTTDKRNHPEKYQAQESYDNKNPQRQGRANALRLIRPNNLAELRKMSLGRKFLVDPYIPPSAIIQVMGFNGHGKSLWLLNLLWAAANGQAFGSSVVYDKIRTLYLDFEGSVNTLNERIDDCEALHGPMSDSLTIWNANAADDPMSLIEGENIGKLGQMIDEVKPQIVVIDTVRQAWNGMEENSPASWVKVNNLAVACRNAGISVVLIHHRNKPDKNGHGRESGSTAQLKDLDVQIIVTKVVEEVDQARREAAMPDSATAITDLQGNKYTAWQYLRRSVTPGFVLKMVFEISFGKLRQATDNNVTTYVGMAQDGVTGKWMSVSSLTPMRKALILHERGENEASISTIIGVSQPTVTGWIKSMKKGS